LFLLRLLSFSKLFSTTSTHIGYCFSHCLLFHILLLLFLRLLLATPVCHCIVTLASRFTLRHTLSVSLLLSSHHTSIDASATTTHTHINMSHTYHCFISILHTHILLMVNIILHTTSSIPISLFHISSLSSYLSLLLFFCCWLLHYHYTPHHHTNKVACHCLRLAKAIQRLRGQ